MLGFKKRIRLKLLSLILIGLVFEGLLLVSIKPVYGQPSITLKWSRLAEAGSTYVGPLAADLNSDGFMELVITGYSGAAALNPVSGSVIWRSPYGGYHSPPEIMDLNKDGIPEVLFSVDRINGNAASGVVALHGNNGSVYWYNGNAAGGSNYIAVADINADGYPEIYSASPGKVTALTYDGQIFASTYTYYTCWGGMSIGDTDFDGIFEVYLGERNTAYSASARGLRAFWADNLTEIWSHPDILCSSQAPVLADVDKDGDLEIIILNQGNPGGIAVINTDGSVYRKQLTISGLTSHSNPPVADIDGDGNLELITNGRADHTLYPPKIWDLVQWKLDATLPFRSDEPPGVADVDGDGKLEIINCNSQNITVFKYYAITGNYDIIHTIPLANASPFSIAQDIDNDGKLELVFGVYNDSWVYVYDVEALAPTPRPRSGLYFYSQYRTRVPVFVPPPGPQAPEISEISPSDGAANVPVSLPHLAFKLTDYQSDPINYTVTTNPDIGSGSGTKVPNRKIRVPINGLSYSTTYAWTVTATDGTHTTTKTFTFTTSDIPPWYDTSWLYRRAIIIDRAKVAADQTDFPVLIELTDSGLIGKVQTDGYDFVFTDSSNMKLSHEIELYDNSIGRLIAWVKIPSLSSTANTVLYMYYGNPSCENQQNPVAVWDASYKLVLHLDEKSGAHYDSTANGNNGTPLNGVAQGVTGKIDGADTFDGSNDYVEVPHSNNLAGYTQAFTVSFLVRLEDTSRRQTILCKYTTGNMRSWQLEYDPVGRPNNPFWFFASQDGVNYREWWASFVPQANTWYYVTVVWEANTIPKFYINGALVSTIGTNTIPSIYNNVGVPLHIGRSAYVAGRYLKGSLDEIRISNPARSASYILTSYNNQLYPSTFYTIGAEEGLPGEPMILDPSPANEATNVPITLNQLSFNLTDYQKDPLDFTVTTNPNIGSLSQTNVPNGRYTVPVSGVAYSTTYTWTVTVSDGTHVTTKTFNFTTELAPAADDIIFNSKFDMGNLINVKYQSGAPGYRYYIAATNYTTVSFADKHWWFYFSMENIAGKTVTIKIVNGTSADYSTDPSSGNRWPNIEPVYSYDNINWQRVPLSRVAFDRTARTFTMNVTVPTTQNKIWLAPLPPYNIAKRDALLAEFASNPYLTVTSLGTTPGGQQLKVATITDPAYPDAGKFKSYVIAQQHSGEVPGSWDAEGLIRYLLSDDPTAAAIRRSYIFRIVPIVNVDGVYYGVSRYTPLRSGVQYDLNRQWNTNPITNAQFEVRVIYQDIQNFKPHSFNDMHSTINTEQTSPEEALTYRYSTLTTEYTNFMNRIRDGGWPETVRAASSLAGGAFQNVRSRLGVTFSLSWENPHDELSSNRGVKLTVNDWITWGQGWAKGNYLYFGDAKATLTVSVSPIGSGSVVKNPDSATYAYGTSVQLTAVAGVGYTFSHWTGNLTGNLNPATIVMTGNKTVTAVFTESEYSLTIYVEGSGSVSRNDTGPYYYGSVVKLTAIADPNWIFSEWSGDLTGTDNPATIIITQNMVITAHFTGQQYTITASVSGVGGTIEPSGSIIVTHGQDQTFIPDPDIGYHVSDITIDGIPIGPAPSYTFYSVDSDHSIIAVFALNEYALTINIVGDGSVAKNPNKISYTHGEIVQLTATASSSWTFSGWSGDLSGIASPTTITMTGDKTVTATFTQNNWWSLDWQYRRTITIDRTKVSGTQTDFPVLIELTDSGLIDKAQPDGNDFVFTDTNNVKLNHEIERYDNSIGRLVVWVKVPSLSSTTDTLLYMYYGNPSCGSQQNAVAVWDTSYKMVLHLDEQTGMHYDSTANGNNGTPYNGVLQGVSGKIYGADTFDGTNDHIEVAHSNILSGYTEAFTASFWIRLDDTSRRQTVLNKYNTAGDQRGWFIEYDPAVRPTRPFGFFASYDGVNYREWYASFVPTTGEWYHVTVVWEANAVPKFYINGALVATVGTATIPSIYNNSGAPLHIAKCTYYTQRYFKGSLDEITVSNPARSASWILTSYNNQLNPTTFYSVGAEEAFEESYVLTVVIDGHGSVTRDPDKTSYEYGESITLTAIPGYGYQFQGWSGDLTGTDNPAYVTMTKNMVINAHFAVKQYTITASVTDIGGTIEPSGAVVVSHGEDQTFTITADIGYHIVDVVVDGESQGEITAYTFYEVNKDHTITAFFALNPNTPPEASGLSILPSDPKTNDDLVGSYVYYDAEGDLEAGTEIRWYRNGELVESINDELNVPISLTQKGDTWYFTVKPRDGKEFGTLQTSSTVTVLNTAPEASNLNMTPSSPSSSDDLVASYDFSDVDGDFNTGSEIMWYIDDVLQSDLNGLPVVPASYTARGEIWYFTVRPSDGTDYGDLQTSASVTIQNSPPTIVSRYPETDPTTLEGSSQEFNVTCSDTDGDTIEIQWYLNNEPVSTDDRYVFTSDYTSAGIYNVTVTVSDGLVQIKYEWTLTVTDVGPVLDMPFDTSVSPTPDNSGYGNNGVINGATWTTAGNGSYYFDGNDHIKVTDAVSLDGNGNWDQLTIELWLYMTTSPQNGARILRKGGSSAPYSYQIGFQTSNDRLYFDVWNPNLYEVEYTTLLTAKTWYHVVCVYKSGVGSKIYINGVDINAVKVGTGSETGLIAASRGLDLFIGCRYGTQNYFTGLLDDMKVFFKGLPLSQIQRHYDQSKDVHVNTAPVITSYTPADPEPQVDEGQSLQFTHTSIDPERNPLTYSWLLEGIQQATTQNWLYQSDFDDAGFYNVTLVVSDGSLITTQYWNVDVINVNRAPTITDYYPDTDPTIPEGQPQEFNITCSDPDNDDLLIQWYLDNAPVGTTNSTSYTFSGSAGTYPVAVSASDGLATVWQNWTLTVTAGNVPPSITSVTISPKPAYNDNTLTATPAGWFDPDGDPEGYVYQWQKWDGVAWQEIASATSSTLDPSHFAKGDQIRIACTPYDGEDYGETKYDAVIIENRAPTISGYTPMIDYPCIDQTQQQAFSVTATDPDGDSLSYEWYIDGTLTSTTDNYSFDAVAGTSGTHNVTLIVTDGTEQVRHRWFLTVDANLVMPFDTDASPIIDYAGKDNNGTSTGATWTTNGKIGGCYSFDGVNDYITIPDAGNLDGDGTWTEITIEFWIYLSVDQTTSKILTKMSTSGEAKRSYQIGLQSSTPYNRIYGAVVIGANSYQEIGSPQLTSGVWYHVALTYKSGDRLRLYINGIEVASSTGILSGNIQASPDKPLYLGCRYGTEGWFNGRLDEVRIFPKALTNQQINQSYYQIKSLLISSPPTAAQLASSGLMYISTLLALPLICCALLISKKERRRTPPRFSPTSSTARN